MAIVDLSLLAAPDVVDELDYETILAERKATLVSLYPEEQQEVVARTLTLESEPVVKLLQPGQRRARSVCVPKLTRPSAGIKPCQTSA